MTMSSGICSTRHHKYRQPARSDPRESSYAVSPTVADTDIALLTIAVLTTRIIVVLRRGNALEFIWQVILRTTFLDILTTGQTAKSDLCQQKDS